MIITDAGVRKAGLLAPVEAAFAGAETAIPAVFDDVPPDSSTAKIIASREPSQPTTVRRGWLWGEGATRA